MMEQANRILTVLEEAGYEAISLAEQCVIF